MNILDNYCASDLELSSKLEEMFEKNFVSVLQGMDETQEDPKPKLMKVIEVQENVINAFLRTKAKAGALCTIPTLRMIAVVRKCCLQAVTSIPEKSEKATGLQALAEPNHQVSHCLFFIIDRLKCHDNKLIHSVLPFATDSVALEIQLRLRLMAKLADLSHSANQQ